MTDSDHAVLLVQRGDAVYVEHAPDIADFSLELIQAGEEIGSITVVGQDIVLHAENGDFHYRRCAQQPELARTLRMQRIHD
jgi:hypothetical protein